MVLKLLLKADDPKMCNCCATLRTITVHLTDNFLLQRTLRKVRIAINLQFNPGKSRPNGQTFLHSGKFCRAGVKDSPLPQVIDIQPVIPHLGKKNYIAFRPGGDTANVP